MELLEKRSLPSILVSPALKRILEAILITSGETKATLKMGGTFLMTSFGLLDSATPESDPPTVAQHIQFLNLINSHVFSLKCYTSVIDITAFPSSPPSSTEQ